VGGNRGSQGQPTPDTDWVGTVGLPPQVLKEAKLRKQDEEEAFTSDQQEAWRARVKQFFKCRGQTTKQQRKEAKKKLFVQPRQPSLDWLRAVSHALDAGAGMGLEMFDNVADLPDQVEVSAPTSSGSSTAAAAAHDLPATLTICMDQEASQWSALNFLQTGLFLNVVGLRDPFHRSWNDLSASLRKAGAWPAYVNSLFVFNISYGPWQHAAFFRKMQSSAASLQKLIQPDDPLLLKFWPAIMADVGTSSTLDSHSGSAARSQYLEEYIHDKAFSVKGPKASISRWFSWMGSQAFWDKSWHSKAMSIVHLAIHEGWACQAEEIWDSMPTLTAAEALGDHSSSSKLKATRSAKAKINELVVKSQNSLHAVARLMCDRELLSMTRLIALASQPEYTAFTQLQKTLKGPEASIAQYSSWAHWGWLDVCRETSAALQQLDLMERAGFTVSFTSAHNRLSLKSADVALEDSLASSLGKLVFNIISERSGSMIWHTSFYPGRMAGIFKEESADDIVAELRQCTVACRAAQDSQVTSAKKIARQCPLSTTFMRWCIAIAEEAGWVCTGKLKSFVGMVFQGITQTRIVEETNQRLRDKEKRDSSSKELQHLKMWETPVHHKMLEKYAFTEVKARPQSCRPPSESLGHLFDPRPPPTQRKKRKRDEDEPTPELDAKQKMDLRLEGVMGRQDWVVYNPESLQNQIANLELMKWCHSQELDWQQVNQAWKAQLAPEGQLMVEKSKSTVWIVLGAYPSAVLLCPARKLRDKFWTWDIGSMLQWRFLFDLDDWRVVQTIYVSPLHLWAAGEKQHSQVVFKVVGRWMPVLNFQCKTGFAKVPEAVLAKVYEDQGWEQPGTSDGFDRRQELVLGLMARVDPAFTQEAALEALHTAHIQAHPEANCHVQVDQEMLRDVVIVEEQGQLNNLLKKAQGAQEKAEVKQTSAKEAVARHLKKKAAKTSPQEANARTAPRWVPREAGEEKLEEVLKFITTHAPASGSVKPDANNGRWFLVHPLLGRRSLSWSERGHCKAAGMVLHQLWSWHTACTGQPPPFALDDLLPQESSASGAAFPGGAARSSTD